MRRSFLWTTAALAASACSRPSTRPPESGAETETIALLHLAPGPGSIEKNRAALVQAARVAADSGASLLLSPELSVSGYSFSSIAGTDWIETQPDGWVRALQSVVRELGVTFIVGLPERDPSTDKLHNTMLALGPEGQILGKHRKVRTLEVGSEAWSSPGERSVPVALPRFGSVGMFICADAVDPKIAQNLKDQGARLLLSSANWAPGQYGPSGEWEQCSAQTSLPLIVCNRTGVGRTLDFRESQSVVVCRGERRLSLSSAEPCIFLLDWDVEAGEPRAHEQIIL